MKGKVSSSLFIDKKTTKSIADIMIQATAEEFGLTEEEIKSCAANYLDLNREDYPTVDSPFSISGSQSFVAN